MPVRFTVLPHHNLILFTYWGDVGLRESQEVIAAAARHPDSRPWMRQLCDLSGVTGVERDYPALIRMQAAVIRDLITPDGPVVVLFYAPTRPGHEMALMARKSWEGLDAVRVLIQDSVVGALGILGLRAGSLDELESAL